VTSLADALQLDFAILHKEVHHTAQVSGAEEIKLTLVGDVRDKIVFLVDDILDSTYLSLYDH
jgi:ribose-phosphate pyrophosphokinase